MSKVLKSLRIHENTDSVITSLMKLPKHHGRKFNNMVEYLIETHPEFIAQKHKKKIK